ncbi:MAG TPA: hypothetical protein VIJ75_16085 [Hanamia sp.]
MKQLTSKKSQKKQPNSIKATAIALSLFLCASMTGFGQSVNDIPIKDINVEYIQIVGTSKLFSTKVNIAIDFGQEVKAFGGAKQVRIKDADGKNMEFNSMIDALNFMSQNGYSFVQAYAFATGNENVYHYLMRKTEDKGEKVKDSEK